MNDWMYGAMACSPLIEGDRLWFVTNRCETVCLDIAPLRRKEPGEPRRLWTVDMIGQYGVFPRGSKMNVCHLCSIASYKDYLYVITGNGTDHGGVRVPSPTAPSLLCLDKNTGKLIWSDRSPGKNILHGQWASPLVVEIAGRGQVIAPQGDGWVRAFDALTGELIWKFDTNPKTATWKGSGRGARNEILATPVLYNNRVYIANGDYLFNASGPAWLYCLDPTKRGDISVELAVDAAGKVLPSKRVRAVDPEQGERAIANPNSGVVWRYGGPGANAEPEPPVFGGTVSNTVISDGLVIAAELAGFVHCLDADTGEVYWKHDLLSTVLGSPLIVDGKVYIGDMDGVVRVFRVSKEKELIAEIEMESRVDCSPIFANGVLYVAAGDRFYAIEDPQRRRTVRIPRAVYTPTPEDVVEAMLKLAKVGKNDVVYDLGSGDGRIVIAAARDYGCKAVGVEIDRELVRVARDRVRQAGLEELVRIQQDDIFNVDLRKADVVTLYLLAAQNEALIPQLQKAKPGTRIVAHEFPIPGIKPDRVITFTSKEDGEARKVYLFTTPLVPLQKD